MVVLAAACSGSGGGSAGGAGLSRPSPEVTPPAASASPSPCVSGAPVPAHGLSSPLRAYALVAGLNQPDDLLQAGGRLLLGEMGSGRILELGCAGLRALPGRVNGVEGLALLGGVLYAADQPDDRVVSVAADGTLQTLIQLSPVTGVEGVDGIAAGGGEIVVPDAARGRVLWIRPDGTLVRTVGGFSRPAGAWVEPGGDVLIADENLGGVYRVAADGSRARIGGALPEADDVVETAGGTIYAVAVYVRGDVLVKLAGGAWQTLASGSWQPQGLAVDPLGNALVADPVSGTVYLFQSGTLPRLGS